MEIVHIPLRSNRNGSFFNIQSLDVHHIEFQALFNQFHPFIVDRLRILYYNHSFIYSNYGAAFDFYDRKFFTPLDNLYLIS
ncbi:putative alkaline/neutral invertase [Dirofilaria immitis]